MLRILMHPIASMVKRSMTKNDAKTEKGKPLPGGVTEFTDIEYIADGDRGHLLDIYAPAGRGDLPLLVDIHGGGLIYGYKEINKRFCYEMAKLGFVVANVSYRLVPAVTLPDQLRDITAAFRKLTAIAKEYGADPIEIYLTGDSAGAFLALYAAAMTDSAAVRTAFDNEGSDVRAKGMFLVSGMYDMLAGGYMKHLCSYALGKKYKSAPWYKYLDIRRLLGEYTPPRAFLTSSREDMLLAQTEKYVKILDGLGLPYVYDFKEKPACVKGAPTPKIYTHVYPVRYPEWEESRDVMRRAAAYIVAADE